jgi:hypothetical protein
MATPIITLVRDRFGLILAGQVALGNIASYQEFPPEEIDKETAVFPFCGYYLDYENTESRNRLENNTLLFHAEIIHINEENREALLEQGDLIEANLHKAIFEDCKSGLLHNLTQKIERRVPRNIIMFENTGYVIMEYGITMMHNYGDGFNFTDY